MCRRSLDFYFYFLVIELGMWFLVVFFHFFCLLQQDITEACGVSDKGLEEQGRSSVEADEERFGPIARVRAGQACQNSGTI